MKNEKINHAGKISKSSKSTLLEMSKIRGNYELCSRILYNLRLFFINFVLQNTFSQEKMT